MLVEKTDTVPVRSSEDIVRVRQIVRKWAIEAGFSLVDQTKIVTAASEIARNTVDYGGGGTLLLESVREGVRRGLRLVFEDRGPGHRRSEAGDDRRLYVGDGAGAGAQRGEAAVQRVQGRIRPRAGNQGDAGALAMIGLGRSV